MFNSLPFALALLVLQTVTAQDSQACYWPDGSELTALEDYTTCDLDSSGSGASQCCRRGNACLSNGLCFDPAAGSIYRGGCSDKRWPSACPSHCSTLDYLSSAPAPLTRCPPSSLAVAAWSCSQDTTTSCSLPPSAAEYNSTLLAYPLSTTAGASAVKILSLAGSVPIQLLSIPSSSPAAGREGLIGPAIANREKLLGTALAVGFATAVPLLLVAAALSWLLWKERKRRVLAERLGFAGAVIRGYKAGGGGESTTDFAGKGEGVW